MCVCVGGDAIGLSNAKENPIKYADAWPAFFFLPLFGVAV